MQVGHHHEADLRRVDARARAAAPGRPRRARAAGARTGPRARPEVRGGLRRRPRGEGPVSTRTGPALGWRIRKAGQGTYAPLRARDADPVDLQRLEAGRRGARSSRRAAGPRPPTAARRPPSRPRCRPASGSLSGFGSAWTFIGGGQRSLPLLRRDKLAPVAERARSQIFAPGPARRARSASSRAPAPGSGARRRSSWPRLGATVVGCGRRPEPLDETVAAIEAAGGQRRGRGRSTSATRRRSTRSSTGCSSATAASTCSSTTPAASS